MAQIIPRQLSSKELTFKALAVDFNLADKVLKLIMESSMEDLEEFRYMFTCEKDVDVFVAADKTIEGSVQRIQVARLRRAWSSVRQTAARKEAKTSISTVAEMDDLLSDVDLKEVKIQFWKRYKLKYPAEITPCDQIISRCFREVDKRLLTVYDIWKVRSLKYQVTTSRKRKQVGDGLFTFEDEAHMETNHDAEEYLAKLHTYLLATAITGTVKRKSAPIEEAFGADSIQFVTAPWDVLQAYYFRAAAAAAEIPEASRAAWLERTDIAERAVWVSTFRDGEETLGEIVSRTMVRRGAHWDPPSAPAVDDTPHTPRQQGHRTRDHQDTPPRNNKPSREAAHEKPNRSNRDYPENTWRTSKPGTVAQTLLDGKKLCQDWQKSECKVKSVSCDKGLHRCAKVGASGRVCGMNYHGADRCRAR
jgi:hypothetical protein